MSSAAAKSKSLWEDRFHAPSLDSLLAELNRQHLSWAEHIRHFMSELPGVSEHLAWEGVAWRWALSYRTRAAGERALCYFVPQPAHPKLVIPLPLDLLATIDATTVPKWVREGVLQAPLVARNRWTQWELSSKSQIDELLGLATLRLPAMSSPSSRD